MEFQQIIIVGCGGNGSWLSLFLTQYMSVNVDLFYLPIILVDHDTFEDRNRERQFFARPGNKAESLAGTWTKKYGSDLTIQAIPKMVIAREDLGFIDRPAFELIPVDRLIAEYSLVFLCVDKCYPRVVISQYAQTLSNVVLINGGTANHDWVVDVYMKRRGMQNNPLEVKYPDLLTRAATEREELLQPKQMSCTDLMETRVADQTFIANLSTACTMLQVLHSLMSLDTAPETIMGDVLGATDGIRGPVLKPMLPLDLQLVE